MTGWPTFEEELEDYIAWKISEAVDKAVNDKVAKCLDTIADQNEEIGRLHAENAELKRKIAQLEAARG